MKSDIFNIESKSNLAKLLATENIEVQINNVDTASFDVENRILTLPKFKIQSQDVLDMLVGHECSHALHTDSELWQSITDDKLRMACNVLEDARIDKLIQKKYPGLTKNYINGFDLMMEKDFFGIKNFDLEKLSLIDKINMYFKSSKRMTLSFADDEKEFVEKTDNLSSMEDVIALAKDIINYQEQKDQQQMLEENDIESSNKDDKESSKGIDGEKSDDENSEDKTDKDNQNDGKKDDSEDEAEDNTSGSKGQGQNEDMQTSNESDSKNLEPFSRTQDAYDKMVKQVSNAGRNRESERIDYVKLPTPNMKDIVVSWKEHAENMKKFHKYYLVDSQYNREWYLIQKSDFMTFKKDSMKTVNYLVKEFEMKKSATAYKRATTDKTGVLDPLKLKNYKFSDDLFKRLTVLPDAKNHGMMIMLDWSGSMGDILPNVIEQMANLVWFCKKVNIPFEVYSFGQNKVNRYDESVDYENIQCWSKNYSELALDTFGLIQLLTSEMKSKDIDRSIFELKVIANRHHGYVTNIPRYMDLYSTPLNEALITSLELIKKFKTKYKVEKMIFTTMTDGAANQVKGICDNNGEYRHRNSYAVIKRKSKNYHCAHSSYYGYKAKELTNTLMQIIKDEIGTINIGYYLHERVRRDDYGYNYGALNNNDKFKKYKKEKFFAEEKFGYDGYFHLAMNNKITKSNLENLDEDASKGQITSTFKKSMKSRLTSRVFMNNLIEKIA